MNLQLHLWLMTVDDEQPKSRGDEKARIVSISHDGGQTWDTSYVDKNLPDPVNEGSIIHIKIKKKIGIGIL
jgi:sialidase-1